MRKILATAALAALAVSGGAGGARTHDRRIMSPACQRALLPGPKCQSWTVTPPRSISRLRPNVMSGRRHRVTTSPLLAFGRDGGQ